MKPPCLVRAGCRFSSCPTGNRTRLRTRLCISRSGLSALSLLRPFSFSQALSYFCVWRFADNPASPQASIWHYEKGMSAKELILLDAHAVSAGVQLRPSSNELALESYIVILLKSPRPSQYGDLHFLSPNLDILPMEHPLYGSRLTKPRQRAALELGIHRDAWCFFPWDLALVMALTA